MVLYILFELHNKSVYFSIIFIFYLGISYNHILFQAVLLHRPCVRDIIVYYLQQNKWTPLLQLTLKVKIEDRSYYEKSGFKLK